MFITPTNILLIAAVLPGLVLAAYIYKLDAIEKEPMGLLIKLFFFGVLSTIPAAIIETIAINILYNVMGNTMLFLFAETFFAVALVEEGCKYFLLKKGSWRNPNFNYRFDGIVYAACVGIGFAVFENIQYVMSYGLGVALMRAITAVPAHTIFAVFMGHYYGEAKRQYDRGNPLVSENLRKLALVIPVILHGFYDFAASMDSDLFSIIFWGFLIALDIYSLKRVKQDAREDMPA